MQYSFHFVYNTQLLTETYFIWPLCPAGQAPWYSTLLCPDLQPYIKWQCWLIISQVWVFQCYMTVTPSYFEMGLFSSITGFLWSLSTLQVRDHWLLPPLIFWVCPGRHWCLQAVMAFNNLDRIWTRPSIDSLWHSFDWWYFNVYTMSCI